jgi:hypothetical protein
MENFKEKLKTSLRQLSFYSVISLSFVAGASIGYYYDFIKTNYTKQAPVVSVKKDEVKLAIDENNNLLVIRKKDGSYTVYQDSVGYMIFNLYAKNIWGQASTKTTTSN